MTDIQMTSAPRQNPLGRLVKTYPMELMLAGLIVVLIFTAPGFPTLGNLLNVLRTGSMMGIIAFGMTAVIIAGEIDLSVGAGAALSGCIAAWFAGQFTDSLGGVPAVILGVIAAMIVGFFVGFMTGKARQLFNVPTFISTLALFTALRGVANLITGGFPLATFPGWFGFFGGGYLFGIPFPVYVFLVTFIGVHLLMNFTRYGRAVYAVGGNMEAARLSGIDIWATKTMTLALTGVLTAIAGILIASQIGSGIGTTATGLELEVIAAVIIGGTSLFGGKGRVWGTLIGVLFLGCISNGMTLLNFSDYWQQVVQGGIILVAVLLNQVLERAR